MVFDPRPDERSALIYALAISPILRLDTNEYEEQFFQKLADSAAAKLDGGSSDYSFQELSLIYESARGALDVLSGRLTVPLPDDILASVRRFFFVLNGIVPAMLNRFPSLED